MQFDNVTYNLFIAAYKRAMHERALIYEACTDAADVDPAATFYLSRCRQAGFALHDGELLYVFSTAKGKGEALMNHALAHGAARLDCFDGYLPVFYGRYGFVEVNREPNWFAGGPDVVFMQRK